MADHKTLRNDVEEVLRDLLKTPYTSGGTKAQGRPISPTITGNGGSKMVFCL